MIDLGEDLLALLLAGWISWLFWRVYRVSGERRTFALAAVFAVVTAYMAAHAAVGHAFDLPQFEWMESHAAMQTIWLLTLFALAVVLSVGAGWRARLQQKPPEQKRRAA